MIQIIMTYGPSLYDSHIFAVEHVQSKFATVQLYQNSS